MGTIKPTPAEICTTFMETILWHLVDPTAEILNQLGAKVIEHTTSLEFDGVSHLIGNSVSSFGDHRMAMMIAIASSCCQGEIILDDGNCVSKSYPNFWEDFKQLGGNYELG